MKPKKKLCDSCEEEKFIWKNDKGNRYCQYCWNKIKASNAEPTYNKVKPIAPRSSKRINLDKEYFQLREMYLDKHPLCTAALPMCTHNATDIHHMKGRGKQYLVISTWMAVCRKCHMWIETHPVEATDLGFRESKITD